MLRESSPAAEGGCLWITGTLLCIVLSIIESPNLQLLHSLLKGLIIYFRVFYMQIDLSVSCPFGEQLNLVRR